MIHINLTILIAGKNTNDFCTTSISMIKKRSSSTMKNAVEKWETTSYKIGHILLKFYFLFSNKAFRNIPVIFDIQQFLFLRLESSLLFWKTISQVSKGAFILPGFLLQKKSDCWLKMELQTYILWDYVKFPAPRRILPHNGYEDLMEN